MEHTAQTLLLASAVRELAKEHRAAAYEQAKRAAVGKPPVSHGPLIEYGVSQEQWQQNRAAEAQAEEEHLRAVGDFNASWAKENPLEKFFKPALKDLEAIAKLMTEPS